MELLIIRPCISHKKLHPYLPNSYIAIYRKHLKTIKKHTSLFTDLDTLLFTDHRIEESTP